MQLLDALLDQDGILEEQNAPFVWVRLAKTIECKLNEANAKNETMREAIQEAHDYIKASPYPDQQVIAKLKPFIARP